MLFEASADSFQAEDFELFCLDWRYSSNSLSRAFRAVSLNQSTYLDRGHTTYLWQHSGVLHPVFQVRQHQMGILNLTDLVSIGSRLFKPGDNLVRDGAFTVM